jgi:cytochrome d ubiquinol oxidase subunit I
LLLFGEKRLGPRGHLFASLMVFLGSWLSGYFIIATDAWMQHPVGYTLAKDGTFVLTSFWGLVLNPWILWQYTHNMIGAVITGCFVMTAIGAYYLLSNTSESYGRTFVRLGVTVGVVACMLQMFPTGDGQGKNVAAYQPATLAAMEGLFESQESAPVAIIGQPDMAKKRLDNPLEIPGALSFLTYRHWTAQVRGLDTFPPADWPDQVPLLYYSYHIMVGLGTIFIAITLAAGWLLWRRKLFGFRPMLWVLMLSLPFPFIANTAGWITAELGRQPWLIYGLFRTSAGVSTQISGGNALFTLLGFMGLYTVVGILFLFLVQREIERGPEALAKDFVKG